VDITLDSNTGVLNNQGTTEVEQKSNWVSKVGVFLNKLISAKTIDVSTSLDSLKSNFGVAVYDTETSASSDYLATSCSYEETVSFQENTIDTTYFLGNYTQNLTEEYEFLLTSDKINYSFTEKENLYLETIIGLGGSGTYNLEIYDTLSLITDLEIIYNATTYNILIYEKENNKIILNSTSTSDDLQEIYLGLKYISNINTLNLEVSLIREVLGTTINENYYSLPLSVTTDKNPNKIVYDSNGNELKLYQIIGVTVNDYPIFYKNTESSKVTQCEYTETGCFNARVYGSNQAIPIYHFSDYMRVCVTEINGEFVVTPNITAYRSFLEKILNTWWDSKQKLLVAIITVFLVFSVFAGISAITKEVLPMIFGSIISGMILLFFVVEGFIPVWVIMIFGIIGALIGVGIVRNSLLGKGGN